MNNPTTSEQRVERIEQALNDCKLGHPLHIFGQVDSTNMLLKEKAGEGVVEGYTILADSQVKGRCRNAAQWISPSGKGVYMSILLRPAWQALELGFVSFIAAFAVACALEHLGVKNVKLKWPNDVLVGEKKIAGILVEAESTGKRIRYCIVGIGINVLHGTDDFSVLGPGAATSCLLEQCNVSVDAVIIRVIREIQTAYSVLDTPVAQPAGEVSV